LRWAPSSRRWEEVRSKPTTRSSLHGSSPLSPRRQIALLGVLARASKARAQFIIATHSPILLAYPGARIYSFDQVPVASVAYEDLEHVAVTRDFLNDPKRFLAE
jgi:predicted ATPase